MGIRSAAYIIAISLISGMGSIPATIAQAARTSASQPPAKNGQDMGTAGTQGSVSTTVKEIELTEIAVLKDQNRLLKEHNSSLLTTMQWSLGFAALFLLAFLGLVGFLTSGRYRRDKEALSSYLSGEVNTLKSEVTGDLNSWREKALRELEQRIRALEGSMGSLATAAAKEMVKPIDEKLLSIHKDVGILQYETSWRDAEDWEKKGVLANALTYYADVARVAWSLGADFYWKVSEALKEIGRLLKEGGTFDPEEARKLNLFLGKLPKSFDILVKGIRDCL
jgi:hypothetical protein